MATKKKTPNYTEASDELETILTEIESGESDVDELSDRVARAAELIEICRKKLSATALDVRKIVDQLAAEVAEDKGVDDKVATPDKPAAKPTKKATAKRATAKAEDAEGDPNAAADAARPAADPSLFDDDDPPF